MVISSAILTSLTAVLCTVLLDFIIGVGISIKQKTFSVSILPQFIANNLVPYVGGLIILALFANYIPEMEYVFYTGVGLVGVKFTKDALLDKLTILFS